MSRKAIFAASVLVLLAVSSCGSSGGPASYVGYFGNEVDYIHWQQSSSGQLQGTVTADHLSGTAPALKLTVITTPFTGHVNDGAVSLHFRHLFDLNAHVKGWIHGKTLVLNIALSDGLTQAAGFLAGGRDAFNKVIAKLRRQMQNYNSRAARQIRRRRKQ